MVWYRDPPFILFLTSPPCTVSAATTTVVPISLYNCYLRFFYYHIIVSLVKIAIFQNDNLIAIKNKDFLLMKIIVISDYFSTK